MIEQLIIIFNIIVYIPIFLIKGVRERVHKDLGSNSPELNSNFPVLRFRKGLSEEMLGDIPASAFAASVA
jgi:hypothetical protein